MLETKYVGTDWVAGSEGIGAALLRTVMGKVGVIPTCLLKFDFFYFWFLLFSSLCFLGYRCIPSFGVGIAPQGCGNYNLL